MALAGGISLKAIWFRQSQAALTTFISRPILMSGNYPKRTTDPIPTGTQIRCLDIGVGANCVYPIIAKKEYGWAFVGVDIDTQALSSAQENNR